MLNDQKAHQAVTLIHATPYFYEPSGTKSESSSEHSTSSDDSEDRLSDLPW